MPSHTPHRAKPHRNSPTIILRAGLVGMTGEDRLYTSVRRRRRRRERVVSPGGVAVAFHSVERTAPSRATTIFLDFTRCASFTFNRFAQRQQSIGHRVYRHRAPISQNVLPNSCSIFFFFRDLWQCTSGFGAVIGSISVKPNGCPRGRRYADYWTQSVPTTGLSFSASNHG